MKKCNCYIEIANYSNDRDLQMKTVKMKSDSALLAVEVNIMCVLM